MYKTATSLVNGAIIEDLLNLCNDYFIDPFVQPYAGANFECRFCGANKLKNGEADHSSADCPVVKYQDIVNNHKRWIVKI